MPTTAHTEPRSEIADLLQQWKTIMTASRPRWSAPDLTFTQLRALSAIAHRDSLRVSELADELNIKLAAASALADRMTRRQLIVRRTDAGDRRIVHLELSSRGRGLIERLERDRTEHVGKLISRMTSAERDALATTLRAFARLSAEHSVNKGPHGLVIIKRVRC